MLRKISFQKNLLCICHRLIDCISVDRVKFILVFCLLDQFYFTHIVNQTHKQNSILCTQFFTVSKLVPICFTDIVYNTLQPPKMSFVYLINRAKGLNIFDGYVA